MKRDAFTLIELAIVLTIVGLIIGGSMKALQNSRQKAYVNEAKEEVSIAKDAIIGDALEYGNLSTVANFDQNLSPAKGNLNDHNKSFFYYPDTNLSLANSDICAFTATGLQIDFMNGATLDHTIYDVAFVVAAQSANKNLQTGASTSGATTTIKVYRPSDKADDNSNDFTRAYDEFDDVVGWVTLSELKSLIKCKQSINIITEHIPLIEINATTDTNVTIFTDDEPPQNYNWNVKIDSTPTPGNNINYTCNNTNQGSVPNTWLASTISCTKFGFNIKYTVSEPTHKLDVNVSDSYGNYVIKSYVVSQK